MMSKSHRSHLVPIAILCSLLLFCALSYFSQWTYGSIYSNGMQAGWHKVELPNGGSIQIPDDWSINVDENGTDSTITDESGKVILYGFLDNGYDYGTGVEPITQRLPGYDFVRETMRLENGKIRYWYELVYRNVDTNELVTVQAINTRSGGLYCLYSVPDSVDRNIARKMAELL